MSNIFPFAKAICEVDDPLIWTDEKKDLMVKACAEMAAFHQSASPEIAAIYRTAGFSPDQLVDHGDLAKIPPLGVTAMKYELVTSLPHSDAVLKLTSSGTKGMKTQIWFDQGSLDRVQRMLDVYLEQEGIVSDKETNYLVFNYDPEDAGDLGIAYTEKNQLRFAPARNVFYAIKKDDQGEWQFRRDDALATLESYLKQDCPVRIMAMPGFLYEFLRFADNMGEMICPPDSLIITGGGWKAAEDKMISREELRGHCTRFFGIPDERIRDAYGMAEHSAPYFECKNHRFHVAVFNQLLVRDPATMEVLPPGEKGLLELITPFNAMMPTLALLSTDWAVIDPEPCGCGWNSPTFTLLGRAGVSKHKGCAIHADDIVKRG